jgi:hypothetical protein
MRRGLAVAIAVAGLAACFDLAGLSGGDGASPPEGGVAEGGSGADASDDAGLAPDASPDGGTTWCALQHPTARYCADFDEGAALTTYGAVSGPVALDPKAGIGGTTAARFDAMSGTYGNIKATAPTGPAFIDAEVAFIIDVPNPKNPYVRVAELQIEFSGGHYDLSFDINDGVTINEQVNDANAKSVANLNGTTGEYTVVHLTVDVRQWRLTALVNGTKIADGAALQSHPNDLGLGMRLWYGMYSIGASPMTLHIDDVLLDPHD